MIQRTPTSDLKPSAAAPAVSSEIRCRLAVRFWPILMSLMLWAGAVASHAASAVITFTNFPAGISNTYNGVITLQITGLTNGVTNVVVQKFLDANTNGVIDAGDLLVQQFQLAVDQTRVFTNGATQVTVTNFMPADMTSVTGQITAPLNFQNGDFMQSLVGHYLYKISSPLGQFTPVTNLFIVTNAFPSSMVTGAVENASSPAFPNVSNAVVLLLSVQNGGFSVVGGAVANNAGNYALGAPPGTYALAAARSNFVAFVGNLTAQEFNINANATNAETVLLYQATTNITGKALNAATNSIGVPGLLGLAESTNDYLSLYFTDTNGNFIAPVTASNAWVAPIDSSAASFEGYLIWETNQLLNITNNGVNVTNALPPANAIFYGTVTNNSGHVMPGVFMYAVDSAGRQSSALTDQHGDYVLGAVGETNQWQVAFPTADNPGLTNNYVFSPGYVQTNINAGQAININFTLALAFYTISGSVEDVDGNPIANVQVGAVATNIDGLAYQAFSATTDASGDYSLNVAPGTWTVSVSTNSLQSLGYTNYPASQTVQISDADATGINFSILLCGEIQILTTNLPNAAVGNYYDTILAATSCQNVTNWILADGITLSAVYDQTNVLYPAGTPVYSSGALAGYLLSTFIYGLEKVIDGYAPVTSNCTASIYYGGGTDTYFTNIMATVDVSGPIASNTVVDIVAEGINRSWTTITPPTSEGNGIYQTTLYRAGSDEYYSGTQPIAYLATNGTFMAGTPGPTNIVAHLAGNFRSLNGDNSENVASTTPYTNANDAIVWLKNGQNYGEYTISAYGIQGGSLPPGLTLYPDGTIQGTPTSAGTNGGTFNFTVAAMDLSTNSAVQPLSIFVYPVTTISVPGAQSSSVQQSNTFNLQVNGVTTGLAYTVLMSTNLASTNWTSLFTTNAANTNSFVVPDTAATNQARFYRIEIGP